MESGGLVNPPSSQGSHANTSDHPPQDSSKQPAKQNSWPTFKIALRKRANRLLHPKPTQFTVFPLLPKELQLRIIRVALQERIVVIVESSPKVLGWWSTPHPFSRVNKAFREETFLRRPEKFALTAPSSGEAKEGDVEGDDEDEEGEEDEWELGLKKEKKDKGPQIVAPPKIRFDFDYNVLALPSSPLWPWHTLQKYCVPDMERLEIVIIIWNAPLWELLVPHLCKLRSLKTIALIHENFIQQSKLKRGEGHYCTSEGPFCNYENLARKSLELELLRHQVWDNIGPVPAVCSLRLTRFSDNSRRPPMAIYRPVQAIKNWCIRDRQIAARFARR